MLNVTWIAAAEAPSEAPSGLVNSAQTYCGLEIAIMQTRPSRSWIQRVDAAGTAMGALVVVLLMRNSGRQLVRMQAGCQSAAFPCSRKRGSVRPDEGAIA